MTGHPMDHSVDSYRAMEHSVGHPNYISCTPVGNPVPTPADRSTSSFLCRTLCPTHVAFLLAGHTMDHSLEEELELTN